MEREYKKIIARQIIPDDLVFNILPKLPGQSLVRFKCVCKPWLSFITQLKFHDQNLILSYSNFVQCVKLDQPSSSQKMKAVPLDFPIKVPDGCTPKVIGSCNGLICISMEKKESSGECETFVLWNPFTGRYNKVQLSKPDLTDLWSKSFGFGHDHHTNDYKIVRLSWDIRRKCNFFQVYSRNYDSWENGLPYSKRISVPNQVGIFTQNALYWKRGRNPYQDTSEHVNIIIRFDLSTNKFRKIQRPDNLAKQYDFDIGVFDGQLCMVQYNIAGGYMDMWALEEIGEKKQNWIKMINVSLSPNLFSSYEFLSVSFMNNETLLMNMRLFRERSMWMDIYSHKFMLYFPRENTFRESEIEDIQDIECLNDVLTYTKSLVSTTEATH